MGILGNLAIIIVLRKDIRQRNVTSMFMVSLSVADLLLLVIVCPIDVLNYLGTLQLASAANVCRASHYFEMLSAIASALNLTAVSLER